MNSIARAGTLAAALIVVFGQACDETADLDPGEGNVGGARHEAGASDGMGAGGATPGGAGGKADGGTSYGGYAGRPVDSGAPDVVDGSAGTSGVGGSIEAGGRGGAGTSTGGSGAEAGTGAGAVAGIGGVGGGVGGSSTGTGGSTCTQYAYSDRSIIIAENDPCFPNPYNYPGICDTTGDSGAYVIRSRECREAIASDLGCYPFTSLQWELVLVCDPFGGCAWPMRHDQILDCGDHYEIDLTVTQPCEACDGSEPWCIHFFLPGDKPVLARATLEQTTCP